MTTSTIAHPPIVSHDQWLVARKELLTKEKELTRHRDAVNAERRRLPMVRIDTDYVFESPDGKASLLICSTGVANTAAKPESTLSVFDKGEGS